MPAVSSELRSAALATLKGPRPSGCPCDLRPAQPMDVKLELQLGRGKAVQRVVTLVAPHADAPLASLDPWQPPASASTLRAMRCAS